MKQLRYILLSLLFLVIGCSRTTYQLGKSSEIQVINWKQIQHIFTDYTVHELLHAGWYESFLQNRITGRPIIVVGNLDIPTTLFPDATSVSNYIEYKLAQVGVFRVIHADINEYLSETQNSINKMQVWAQNKNAEYILTGKIIPEKSDTGFSVHYALIEADSGKTIWNNSEVHTP